MRIQPTFVLGWAVALLLLAPVADAASAVSDERLAHALDRQMQRAGPTSGAWVRDLTEQRTLYESRSTVPRTLASNTKLFTTAAVLDRFGAESLLDDRFQRAMEGRKLLPRERRVLTGWPLIARLVREVNVYSNNFFAEQLVKALGRQHGRGGTTRQGVAVVQRVMRRLRVRAELHDGSGLDYSNRASPGMVGRLLTAMLSHRERDGFLRSLAVAGRTGTLADRMRDSAARDRCTGKTGTLSGVSTLSGYCTTAGDREFAFSILINGAGLTLAHRVQDRMLGLLARYAG